MAIELLIPVTDEVLSLRTMSEPQTLGNKLKIHSEKAGIPSFKNARIAIVGINETCFIDTNNSDSSIFETRNSCLF